MTERDLFSSSSPSPAADEPDRQSERKVLSVSQLNRKSRQLLETHLPLLWVEGEISNIARPSSGHWYFTLKDEKAQVRCAMFRNRNTLVRFKPEQGQQVLVRARVSIYEGRGDYQLIVEHMEEAGFGVLQRAFDALKAKLANEGLFDPEHKQAVPCPARHIAVITSPTGAAIHDVLTVLGRRFPSIPVTVIPVAVQGQGAAAQIVRALEIANARSEFDVILLCRGGGSLEDMWPFNEEIVARAVFDSDLPVVCAVGHEVDFSIADFVADMRAPTPSAAAELLSPDGEEWWRTFAGYEVLLLQAMQRRLRQARQTLQACTARLRHPGERLQHSAQHLDHLELRLGRAIAYQLHCARASFQEYATRLQQYRPTQSIHYYRNQVEHLTYRLSLLTRQSLQQRQQRLAQSMGLLDSVSPLNIVQRGYALVLNQRGEIVRNSTAVRDNERLTAKLAQGELLCRVEDRRDHYQQITAAFGAGDSGTRNKAKRSTKPDK